MNTYFGILKWGRSPLRRYSTLLFYISRQQQPLKNGRNKKHCYYLRYFKLQLNDLEVLSFSCSPAKWIRKRLNHFFKASFAALVTEICIGTSCLPSYRNDERHKLLLVQYLVMLFLFTILRICSQTSLWLVHSSCLCPVLRDKRE